MRARPWLLVGALGAQAGCSSPPVDFVARQGGAAAWPANSRLAVQGALDGDLEAIELDVVLTGDRIPVLHATPYLDEDTCLTAAGDPITDRVWMLENTLEDIQEGYRCGASPDPDHPDAAIAPDSLVTLDELATLIAEAPDLVVMLDVQQWSNVSHPPAMTAAEVLERWWRAELPNPTIWATASPDAARALVDRADGAGQPIDVWLRWPYVPPESAPWLVEVGRTLTTTVGVEDARAAADEAQATGLVLSASQARADVVDALAGDGLGVAIEPVESAAAAKAFGRWPVDWLLSDVPGGPQ